MTPPTPISRDELESHIRFKLLNHNMPPTIHAGGSDGNITSALGQIMAVVDFYVAQEVAKARIDELEMAILMKGKSLVGDSIMDTSNLEGGHPNMIVASILDARLASLLDKKAAPLPKAKKKS